MSAEYKGQNPLDIAKQAEKDLNSHANIHGTDPNTANPNRGPNASDSGKHRNPARHLCHQLSFP